MKQFALDYTLVHGNPTPNEIAHYLMAKEMIESMNKKEEKIGEGNMRPYWKQDLLGEATKSEYELKKTRVFIEDNKCFLELTYRIETEFEISELNLPKVEVPLSIFHIVFASDDDKCWIEGRGDNQFILHPDKNKCYYTKKIIKKKTRKMTVSEIEKALGYSVEIVSEK